MLPHAPVTSVHLAEGSMTVGDLCAAIVTVSDNPAANILLAATGGPSALTQFLGGIGAVLEQAQAEIGGLVAAAIARQ